MTLDRMLEGAIWREGRLLAQARRNLAAVEHDARDCDHLLLASIVRIREEFRRIKAEP